MEKDERKDKETIPTEFQTLIAGVFPNTRYFDARFDLLQVQIDELKKNQDDLKTGLKDLKDDMNYRFQQVDKRFEQVDKRFEQIIASIEKLSDKLDNRDRDLRNFTLKMFSISIGISVLGVLGAFLKMIGVF